MTITIGNTRGYWYYFDGKHICVNEAPLTRQELPPTARNVAGPYCARAYVRAAADRAARTIVTAGV